MIIVPMWCTDVSNLAPICGILIIRDIARHGQGGVKPDQIASKSDQINYSPFLCFWLACFGLNGWSKLVIQYCQAQPRYVALNRLWGTWCGAPPVVALLSCILWLCQAQFSETNPAPCISTAMLIDLPRRLRSKWSAPLEFFVLANFVEICTYFLNFSSVHSR